MVYNPPEILAGESRHHGTSLLLLITCLADASFKGYDGRPADCWQIGIVLCMLLIGHNPFDDLEVDSQISQSVFGESMKGCLRDGDLRTCANVVQGRMELPSRKLGSEDTEGASFRAFCEEGRADAFCEKFEFSSSTSSLLILP